MTGHAPSTAPSEQATGPSTSRTENKPTSAVVMVFPDGQMQLGVQEVEMAERDQSKEDLLNKDEDLGSSSHQPVA